MYPGVLAVFVVEFLGVLVQMVAWGLKKVPRKFEELFKKMTFFYQKYHRRLR